ncbi:MAG: DUF4394 domain-containing protein [Chloroflexia bacterium]
MTANNRKLKSALLAIVGVLATALSVWGGNTTPAGVANAAVAPVNGAAYAPLTEFSTPDLLSWIGEYDNFSGVAASNIDGSITAVWGAAPDEDSGVVYAASNNGFAQQTDIMGVQYNDPNLVNCKNQFGPCSVAADGLGRRHFVYWNYGSSFCIHYAMVNPDGTLVRDEEVPGSCDSGTPRKLIALDVDSNFTVHIAGSRDNQYVTRYWQRLDNGDYSAINEFVPMHCGATGDLTMAVNSQGMPMLAFKDCADTGNNSDIWTAKRLAVNNWVLEDISSSCCQECPGSSKAYLPNLVGSPDGGFRISWADGRCGESQNTDIYYREWLPATGWDNSPIVRVVHNSGKSYHNAIAVDASGEAHIVWADDTSSPFAYYRTFYSHGRGTTFTPIEIPFQSWAPGSWQRDVAIDAAFGHIHVTLSTVRTDPLKDVYYSYAVTGPVFTPTPTATPTPPCFGDDDLDFQDVCEGSTFFNFIRKVHAAGVIAGYACGSAGEPCGPGNKPYYRPNNSITRGQVAKVVVLGAGLTVITPTVATFEDVPVGHTFFSYVETAFANTVVGGYPCGGPGEPCVPPGNKPYYRPSNNVTRGQLTKMVSIAFNFTEPVSGQTFEDVPNTNPFYEYIQRLSTRGILTGYACGGAGEPCVPPGNRPYFRTGNGITRAQTAKVIASSMNAPPPTPTNTTTPGPTSTPVSPPACQPLVLAYAVTASGNLVSFNAAAPAVFLSNDPITGLQNGESIEGIDFRPATGQFFALGSTSRVYLMNPTTAVATQLGASGVFTLTGTDFGFDFNPVADRMRVVSDLDQNLRLHPDDGTLAATDTPLAYATGDPNQGEDPNVVGAGYTNSYHGASTTTLYDVDSDLDVLTLQAPPNNGTLSTVGGLGIDVLSTVGFDIRDCNNTAYAAFTLQPIGKGALSSQLYTVNLVSGAATLVGTIGPGNVEVVAMALAPTAMNPPTPTAIARTNR